MTEEQKKNSQLLDVAWIYVADDLPPDPEGNSMHSLKYFCAFAIGDDEYDCDESWTSSTGGANASPFSEKIRGAYE